MCLMPGILLPLPCCCGCPCASDDVTATITWIGICGTCPDPSGDYLLDNFTSYPEADEPYCSWILTCVGTAYSLTIYYYPNLACWCAWLSTGFFAFSAADCGACGGVGFMQDVRADIACVAGQLEGTWDMPGVFSPFFDCAGCTATVTLT